MSIKVIQLCGKHYACFLDEGHIGPCSHEETTPDPGERAVQPAAVRPTVLCFNCGWATELVLLCRRCGKLHAAP